MLLHVELDAVVHLRGRICELAGIGHEQADLIPVHVGVKLLDKHERTCERDVTQ